MNATIASNGSHRRELLLGKPGDCGEVDYCVDALLDDVDWTLLTKRLLGYARFRLSRHGVYAKRYVKSAEDYVQDAVMRLLEGTRRYIDDAHRSLFHFLCSVVDSLISHDAEKARRVRIQPLIADEEDAAPGDVVEDHLASNESLEEQIIVRDKLERFALAQEPELKKYVLLRATGALTTAEEYAASLDTNIPSIRNMDKRLRRQRRNW